RSGSDGELASAQEAIIDASLAGLALLDWLGAEGALAAGHSVGELTALCWAGALDEEAVRALARARARATAALPGMGAMVSITADPARAEALVEDEDVVVAAFNAPEQTVVSGSVEA